MAAAVSAHRMATTALLQQLIHGLTYETLTELRQLCSDRMEQLDWEHVG